MWVVFSASCPVGGVSQVLDFPSVLVELLTESDGSSLAVCDSRKATSQLSHGYEKGVEDYLDKAFSTQAIGDQNSCPCKGLSSTSNNERDVKDMHDDIEHLIYDVHMDVSERCEGVGDEPNDKAKKFYKLVEDGKQEQYLGCKKFSKLSFLIRFYLLKRTHISNSDFLEIFREVLPDASNLPNSFNEARKLIKDIGLHYDKIVACRNDCMLYWKEHEATTSCHVFHSPRWKETQSEN
uniref:Uncharacterized protein n=1 Tax=Chenopodium quinoa TaxID=63459 RepID=A0A803KUV0_CHEQI